MVLRAMVPRSTKTASFAATAVALVALAATAVLIARAADGARPAASDLIAKDVARLRHILDTDTVTVGFFADVKRATAAPVASAEQALAQGRPKFALLRLGAARVTLEPGLHAAPQGGRTTADFEAEWQREGARFAPPAEAGRRFAAVTPALAKALAQAGAAQAHGTYDASLAYGHATESIFGWYYLAQAGSHLEFAEFAAKALPADPKRRAPALRGLTPEIKALRAEMLAVYKPPLSIDRHPEFIGASAAVKEAMEYSAAGLHEAALLRYLQAAVRFAPLRADAKPLAAEALAAATKEWQERLAEPGVDHSLGELFLEVAAGDADTARAGNAVVASAVVEDVLPRYVAALSPAARPVVAKPAEATVTLVRWPYT
jgi:hypothetical protein